MKKYNILVVFTLTILMVSCSHQNTNKELKDIVDSEYMINTGDEYYDIIYNENGYTLEDLDTYYQKIKGTRMQEKNYNNLRKIIINTMYLSKDLLKVEDKTFIEYYVNELISMPYISDMEMFYRMLTGLSGHWEKSKIKETAKTILARNYNYINKNFPNPMEIYNLPQQASGGQSMMYLMTMDVD